MAALLALGISSAPGWRELRWFALCALFAAMFNLTNVGVTLEVDEATRGTLARLGLFFGGLHTVMWFVYTRAQSGAPLSRFDRAFLTGGVVLSCLSLVPGLVMTSHSFSRSVPWLHLVYRDMEPTPFGVAAYAYHNVGLIVLLTRQVVRWRRREPDAAALSIALGAVLVGAIHDTLATTRYLDTPYILDEALLVLVVAVGGSVVSRFVASARKLEDTVARLEATQQELVRRERLAALGELAAVVAHEIRNPLAVVFNALAGLRKTRTAAGNDDAEKLLTIAQEEAERLRDIVSDLIDFARPREPHFAEADLSETVKGAVHAATNEARTSDDEVVISVPTDLGTLECDEKLVRRAVINLVTNALQATDRQGAVRVSVEPDAKSVAVVVTDDGRGVPDEVKDRIFTPFFTTRPMGTGLGLAVVQRCAEAHGGRVELDVPSPRGARFTLRLPRRGLSKGAP